MIEVIYLIPKNIKVKKEIFKGYGLFELIFVIIGLIIGYLLSFIAKNITFKLIIGSVFPISFILLTLPLPNGLTVLKIFKKYFSYKFNQKTYKRLTKIDN
ncbi:MAG: PrgI family protein [Tissierellia bacterium]|nr:PrgI family protein [Tissierellia bacterium]